MPIDISRCALYLCTPDRDDIERFVSACIAGGVDIVQLREKHLEARALIGRAKLVRRVCGDHGIPFIMNDRPDLALEVDADGVHLGQDDAPVSLARRILGEDRIVGLSTHHNAEFAAGLDEPVDYLSTGPVVPTPTKPGRAGTGLGFIETARILVGSRERNGTPRPFFVTGGVTPESVPSIVGAGGTRLVVVRYLTESSDPQLSAHELREALTRATESARDRT